jgi:hypothetical protein
LKFCDISQLLALQPVTAPNPRIVTILSWVRVTLRSRRLVCTRLSLNRHIETPSLRIVLKPLSWTRRPESPKNLLETCRRWNDSGVLSYSRESAVQFNRLPPVTS